MSHTSHARRRFDTGRADSGRGTPPRRPLRPGGRLGILLPLVLAVAAASSPTSTNGPRGKPIRPPAARPDSLSTEFLRSNIVTLPGGVVITNLPREFLPSSPTNTIRLPTRAARKFEPLGYQPTSFTVLARYFPNLPEPGSAAAASPQSRWEYVRGQIPDDVLALHGRKVALAGFILPLSLADGRATEFLLLRTQSACCFGLVPRVNEIVIVRMEPPGVQPRPDTPVVAAGTLSVKWIGEGDQLTALYEMAGDVVEVADDF